MLTKDLIAKIRRIEIRTRRIVDELTGGAYQSVFKGQGMEFNEVREYLPGDDVRSIDWNVTARFGHPFIKKFIEERELTVLLLVDVSASGDFGAGDVSKNEQAAELAALLAFNAIRNNDQVGLLLFSSQPELFVPPRKGRRHVLRLIRDLLAFERHDRGTNVRGAVENMMRLATRRAVVFLISDLIDTEFEQTLRIAGRKHDLITMRMVDRREMALPRTGYLAIEDAETGENTFFSGHSRRALEAYAAESGTRRAEQTQWYRRSGLDLIDIYPGEDYVKPLMRFFREREKRR